ncbi:MAG TPA: MFS transporter, partial [Pseudonocardiaceae bacterium]
TFRESSAAAKALLLGVFVNKLGAFVQVFLVLFLTERGFSGVQAGVALGVYGAGSVFGELAGGSMSDRLGPRRTIVLGMAGTALLVLAVLYLRNYPAMLVAVGVVGLVSHVYRPASASLLAEVTPPHRQVMIFAMYRLALNVGTTAAPLIGALLLAVSYDLLFWAEALAALAYVAIAVVALPKDRVATPPTGTTTAAATVAAEGAADTTAADTTAADAAAAPVRAPRGGYLGLIADRRYLLYLVAMLVNAAVYVQYLGTLPLAMRDAGLATFWYGAMVALNGAIVICFELLVTKVVQHWPARVVIAVGFLLLGGGFAAYALPLGLAAFVIGTLAWTLAEIVGGPMMFAYPAQAGPAGLRGRYLGAAHAMFGVGSAVGPVLGVFVYYQAGSQVWVWCGLVSLLGLAAAWYGMGARRDAPEVVGVENR